MIIRSHSRGGGGTFNSYYKSNNSVLFLVHRLFSALAAGFLPQPDTLLLIHSDLYSLNMALLWSPVI